MLIPDVVVRHRHHGSQSDLSESRRVGASILDEVISQSYAATAVRLMRRRGTLETIRNLYTNEDRTARTTAVSVVRSSRRDRGLFTTPLSRRILVPQLVRLLVVALLGGRCGRRLMP
jgi:hypothetical protein